MGEALYQSHVCFAARLSVCPSTGIRSEILDARERVLRACAHD
jgi:hypothetical protein